MDEIWKVLMNYDITKLENGEYVDENNDLISYPAGFASMKALWNSYKRQAIKREYVFTLRLDEFYHITQENCYYCGAEPQNIIHPTHANGEYIYNGLDRIDNTKGYTIDNVVPCCKTCNYAKHNLTLKEFKDWIEKVYKRRELWKKEILNKKDEVI